MILIVQILFSVENYHMIILLNNIHCTSVVISKLEMNCCTLIYYCVYITDLHNLKLDNVNTILLL